MYLMTCVVICVFITAGKGQNRVSLKENIVYTYSHFSLSHVEALTSCLANYNAQLVTVPDEPVEIHLKQEMKKIYGKEYYWMGLRYSTQNAWTWPNNVGPIYNNWEANNISGQCAAISSKTGYWRPEECNTNLPYICSAKLTNRYQMYNHSVEYLFSDVKLRYQDAAKICSQKNMEILVINSMEKKRFVINHIHTTDNNADTYYFNKMSIVANSTNIFHHRETNFTDPLDDDTICPFITIGMNITAKLETGPCTNTRKFICEEIEVTTPNPDAMITEKTSNYDKTMHTSTVTMVEIVNTNAEKYKAEWTTDGGSGFNQSQPSYNLIIITALISLHQMLCWL